MGAIIQLRDGYVEAAAPRLRGAKIYLDVPAVGGARRFQIPGEDVVALLRPEGHPADEWVNLNVARPLKVDCETVANCH